MSLSILNRLEGDPSIFTGKKIVVVGDIALDRTFLCRPASPGFHATHGRETIFDIELGGDDFGTVGSSNNTCLFCKSLGADSLLITVIGDDEEGGRVQKVLNSQGIMNICLKIDGVQTVTKLRFFVFSEHQGEYDLVYRVDKEPNYSLSYSKAEELISQPDFLHWFGEELATSDALLLNDTEKGLLSQHVLDVLAKVIEDVNRERKKNGRPNIVTIVDPKNDWDKFKGFPIHILKPNEREASCAVDLSGVDFGSDDNLKILAERLYQRYRDYFQKIVITLGRHGAALLEAGKEGAMLYRFPVIETKSSLFHVATHCGDMFASALILGLVVGEDLFSAVTFANCVGSLQFTKLTGTKVTRDDLLKEGDLDHLRRHYRSHRLVATIPDEKERIVTEILGRVGQRIDYRTAQYSQKGRQSSLLAAQEFSSALDTLSGHIRPGGIVFIHGESGSGKGAILENMSVFIDGYSKELDCYNAYDVLDKEDGLEEAIRRAEERKTCIILDEIQNASDAGITRVLSTFPQQDFDKPFCLICAGHYDKECEALRDLYYRSSPFEIQPYRHPRRRYDLPFIIAKILRERCRQVRNIMALALRELLRCDYDSESSKNWRALTTVLTASCNAVTGDTLDWEHLDLNSIGIKKAETKPSIPGLNYKIEIVD